MSQDITELMMAAIAAVIAETQWTATTPHKWPANPVRHGPKTTADK